MNKKSNAAGLAVQARAVTLYHQDDVEQDDPVFALAERLMRLYDAHGEALTAFNPCEELMIRWRKKHPGADERQKRTAELLTGFAAADAIASEACHASWEAMEALRDAVPLTFAGLAAKAKAARYIGDQKMDSQIADSLVRDIGVLAGEIKPDAEVLRLFVRPAQIGRDLVSPYEGVGAEE